MADEGKATAARLRLWHAALAAGMPADLALRAVADAEPDAGDRDALWKAADHLSAAGRLGSADGAFPGPAYVAGFLLSGTVGNCLSEALSEAARFADREAAFATEGGAPLWWDMLGSLLRLGMPLPQALETLSQAPFGEGLRQAAVLAREDVREGQSLSAALSRQENVFSPMACRILAAAETAGRVPEACRAIAECGALLPTEGGAAEARHSPAPPVEVALAAELLSQAVCLGATEVHFQKEERGRRMRVRARVPAGLTTLRVLNAVDAVPPTRLVPALKSLAGLDVLERRRFQSTVLPFPAGGTPTHSLRITVHPTAVGEAASVAITPLDAKILSLEDLGMAEGHLEVVRRLMHRPCGLIVVAGPPRSGRRSTAYALLSALSNAGNCVATLESAIQQRLPGVHQALLSPERGITPSAGVLSLLDQDPDVLYVSPVEDAETLGACLEAAMTGHLVLASCAAGSTAEAYEGLLRLAPEWALAATSILAVVGQRSLRLVCPECCRHDAFTAPERRALRAAGIPEDAVAAGTAARAGGCPACAGTGYRGRAAVFEILDLDGSLLSAPEPQTSLEEWCGGVAVTGGSLAFHAAGKVVAGLTTIEEASRAAGV